MYEAANIEIHSLTVGTDTPVSLAKEVALNSLPVRAASRRTNVSFEEEFVSGDVFHAFSQLKVREGQEGELGSISLGMNSELSIEYNLSVAL